MKSLKNHNQQSGMTFIEVVLAVFIIGSLLSSLLLLQSNVLRSIFQFSRVSQRIFLLKNQLVEMVIAHEKKAEEPKKTKNIEDPATTITIKESKPSKDSALKNFESIVIEKVTAKWDQLDEKKQETMITFLYKPEKKET